jgi:hypothetical protein
VKILDELMYAIGNVGVLSGLSKLHFQSFTHPIETNLIKLAKMS